MRETTSDHHPLPPSYGLGRSVRNLNEHYLSIPSSECIVFVCECERVYVSFQYYIEKKKVERANSHYRVRISYPLNKERELLLEQNILMHVQIIIFIIPLYHIYICIWWIHKVHNVRNVPTIVYHIYAFSVFGKINGKIGREKNTANK